MHDGPCCCSSSLNQDVPDHQQDPEVVMIGLCCASSVRCVQLFATPWTEACQAYCPRGISRKEYWSGLPCPPPGDLPNPGIKPRSPELKADSLLREPPGKPNNWPNF